jgi:putative flippase GtrA
MPSGSGPASSTSSERRAFAAYRRLQALWRPRPPPLHQPQGTRSWERFRRLKAAIPLVFRRSRAAQKKALQDVAKASAIDVREFARFILSGVIATIGNMVAVWLARSFLSFEIALLAGIATAITVSFVFSKFFAFRSPSWNRAVGEAARFLIVYATGCAIYWTVAVFIRKFLLAHGVALEAAEAGGILVGAGTMMVTSYCGHRFFTYRTYRRGKRLDGTL